MTITVTELYGSRESTIETDKGNTLTRLFDVLGTDDPRVAIQYGPGKYSGYGIDLTLAKKGCAVTQDRSAPGGGSCRLTCYYCKPETARMENLDEEQWDFMSQQEHIIRAQGGQSHYPPAFNTGDLVGVDGEEVHGVDVYVPKAEWRRRREVTPANMTLGMRQTLLLLEGTVNSALFNGWGAGEVLFLGASMNRRGTGNWMVDYRFLVEPNQTVVVDTTSGSVSVNKLGWGYLWYTRSKTVSGGILKSQVDAVHHAIVYPWGNFALLGL